MTCDTISIFKTMKKTFTVNFSNINPHLYNLELAHAPMDKEQFMQTMFSY